MPHPTPTRTPMAALAVTVAVGALLAAGLRGQDAWLENSLETALAAPQPSARAAIAQPPVAGSESYWLATAAPVETLRPVSFAPVLALGTRVTLGAGAGLRHLEVVGVSELPAVAAAPSEQRLLVVTLRDTADHVASPVRLVLDADAAARLAATQPVSDRAL